MKKLTDSDFVKSVRKRADLSQPRFADMIKVPVATLRGWEQGRRRLTATARALLTTVEAGIRAAKD